MVCSREMGGWEGTNDLEGGDDGWLVKGIVACGGLKDKGGNKWGCLWDISCLGLPGCNVDGRERHPGHKHSSRLANSLNDVMLCFSA